MRNELRKRNTLLIVLSLAIIVIGIVFIFLFKTVFVKDRLFASETAALQLDDTMQHTKLGLKPITDSLIIVKSWAFSGVFAPDNEEEFFKMLIPLLERNNQITGFSFSDSNGRLLELTRREEYWESLRFEYDKVRNEKIHFWTRFDSTGNVVDRWQGMLPELFIEDLLLPDTELSELEQGIYWETPRRATEFNGDITSCATQWMLGGIVYKVSVEFLFEELSGRFINMYHSSHMRVFMLRSDGNIVNLFKGFNVSNDDYNIEKNVVADWKTRNYGRKPMASFSRIDNDGIMYFMRSFSFYEGMGDEIARNESYLGVIFFEDELLKEAKYQDRMFFIIPMSVVVFGVLMIIAVLYFARHDRRLGEHMYELPSCEQDWKTFIAKGEGAFLEFKSALRWNLLKECKDLRIEEAIMKAVSAFGNSEGGILLIGINDEGQIVGLENDYTTLKTPDKDSFELHMRNLLNSEYGIEFTAKNIHIEFPVLEGKEFCAVAVSKSDKPLYVKMTDSKSGAKFEKFYVRSGNSSREIAQLSEIAKFTEGRFKKKK